MASGWDPIALLKGSFKWAEKVEMVKSSKGEDCLLFKGKDKVKVPLTQKTAWVTARKEQMTIGAMWFCLENDGVKYGEYWSKCRA